MLIITYYWPPSGGSGVQRWLKFAKYLPSCGWEPIVYTPSNPDVSAIDESLLKEVAPSLKVIKRRILEPYGIYKMLSGKKRIEANVIGKSSSGGWLKRLSLYVRGNFFIPDPRCWWIRPSVRFLKKWLRTNPVDVIISTGPPHSMHLIAKKLHKITGVPWIADFRDPWTKIFYFKHLRLSKRSEAKHKALEQSVLEEANSIIAVSPSVKKEFEATLPLMQRSKVELITNGFDPADFASVRAAECPGKFVIAHTGLMPQEANPDLFWEALGEIAATNPLFKSELYIATMGQTARGAIDEIERAGLGENLHDFGYVSHLQAIAWQKRADLLLLPLRKEREAAAILTGKFFEYLAGGSRILSIGPVKSIQAEAIKETECGQMVEYTDKEGMKRAISEAYERFKSSSPTHGNAPSLSPTAMKYSRLYLTEHMATLLNKLYEK